MSFRFYVIGSNSFSGACFIKYLLEREYQVSGCSRSIEPHKVLLPYKWLKDHSQFSFNKIDLNQKLDTLVNMIKEFQPDYVVNFAAQGIVAQSWQSPEDWYKTNVLAQVKLHEQLRKFLFIKKYIHVTTPEVYGSTEGWIKESFHFAPSTPYAVSRAACDLHLMSFFKAYDFPVVFTRAANVYGAGQQLYRIIPHTMLCARLGKKLKLHGGGHSIRSFIHMGDVADATYKIAIKGIAGATYHISTRENISIKDLVMKICSLTEVNFDDVVEVTEDRLGKDQAYLLESSKVRDELGWQDQIALDKGLDETLGWIDNNLEVLQKLPQDYFHKT